MINNDPRCHQAYTVVAESLEKRLCASPWRRVEGSALLRWSRPVPAPRPRRNHRRRRPTRPRLHPRRAHRRTLLRAWLAAAHGEALTTAGHADQARRTLDTADTLLPVDPGLRFRNCRSCSSAVFTSTAGAATPSPASVHRSHRPTHRRPRPPPGPIRPRPQRHAGPPRLRRLRVGDREAALTHARQARRLAAQIKSDRHLQQLSHLVLPGGSTPA